jgi:hypothetical protein
LLDTCKWLSHDWEKPAEEIFKRFLSLMKKYEDYFYSEPWPKKFDHRVSTNITDDDYEFLMADPEEFGDRRITVLLRKNIYMDGFMGFFGMLWTDDRIEDIVFRPTYKEVFGKFEEMKQNAKTIPEILAALLTEYSKWTIHDSFTDYLEHNYPDKETRNQIDDLVTELHTEENLPSCKTDSCSWYKRIQNAEIYGQA